MTLTFPEPQRPRKTWDLHVIVQGCWRRAGRDFSLEWEAGAAESASLNIPPSSLPRGRAEGEVVAGALCGYR